MSTLHRLLPLAGSGEIDWRGNPRLAAFKGLNEPDFIQQFTRLRWDRGGLALQEKPDGACIFLEGDDCSVQPMKPQQCRDFPNLWNFPGFEKSCRALPRLLEDEEYARRIAQIKQTGTSAAGDA